MAGYLEDLVQNIYTNCDMSGLDKLNQGLQDAIWYSGELEKNLKDAQKAQQKGFDFHTQAIDKTKEIYQIESQRIKLLAQETRERIKTEELRQNYANKEIRHMQKRNALQKYFTRLLVATFSINTLKNIVNTGSQLQLMQKSIEGLTKSTQDWDFINKASFKLGVGLKTAAEGYKNFYSAANMAGFDKESIQGMYYDILLASRAIGASEQQTGGALLALEQMVSKGTVSMEELRRQLGNAIPGAFEIGAKAMNMTTKEFNAFVKTGKLASTEFVPKFIKALVEAYANGFKDIEQTVNVAQGRLKNAWENFTIEFVSGDAGKALAKGLNDIAELVKSPEFIQLIQVLGTIFSWVVRIVTLAITHLPTILLLLGIRGLLGLIIRIQVETVRLNLVALKMGASFVTASTVAKGAIMSTLIPALRLVWRALLEFLLPLILIEEIIGFIGQKLLKWKVNTILGHFFDKKQKERERRVGIRKTIKDYYGEFDPEFKKYYDRAVKENMSPKDLKNLLDTEARPKPTPSSDRLSYAGGGAYLDKEQNQTIDIDINVNGSDEPTKVAFVVNDVLVNQLISLGLITDVSRTVGAEALV